LIRTDTRPHFTAAIIINDLLSAAPRLSMLRNLFRLLAPPSAHTMYYRRMRAGARNYWQQGTNVLTVSLPTTPSEKTRKIRPEQPEYAISSPLILSQNAKLPLANLPGGH
jgi:hypothetical protein